MSTLNVENIQHPSSSTPAISLDSNGAMTGSFPYPNRNLLYNGAMQVHQRGTSTASITTSNYYTTDRWSIALSSLGTWTQSVENDAPTGSGLAKSVKLLCTTADSTPAAGDYNYFMQRLEGQDLQRIAKGTSSAQQLTLSFWVKSNVTGTYVVGIRDQDNSRYVGATYSVNASATWEKKTITFPADTTGAFDNDNAYSLALWFWLGAGSTFTSGTLNTTWASYSNANVAVGQTNVAAATNNYWQITGVQLETGSVATEFEFEPYETTLAKCQRYCYRYGGQSGNGNRTSAIGAGGGGTTHVFNVFFPVKMRTTPTVTYDLGAGFQSNNGSAAFTISSILLNVGNSDSCQLAAVASGSATGAGLSFYSVNTSGTHTWVQFNAEL
jgi:hypothetical protein